jgi:guanylate kinase
MTKNLFIIDGASGTGKSDMLKYLDIRRTSTKAVTTLRKFTTRPIRPEEAQDDYHLDLDFVTAELFAEYTKAKDFYAYGYGDDQYGFFKSAIEDALNYFQNVFIIIRNKELADQLKNDFPKIRVINAYIYTDIPKVIERLQNAGYSEQKIQFRITRQTFAWRDYLKYSQKYDEIIINNSNETDYERLIEQLLQDYNSEQSDILEISNEEKYQLIKPIIGFKSEIQKRLDKYPFEKNVFLMMKFRPENQLLFEFMRDSLKDNGFNCVRADQAEWDITRSVYNPIATLYCCKYGIALFDQAEESNEFSPNVAYELGIMHHQHKECLILRHSSLKPFPFDLVKDLYREYTNDLQIKKIIKDWVYRITTK